MRSSGRKKGHRKGRKHHTGGSAKAKLAQAKKLITQASKHC